MSRCKRCIHRNTTITHVHVTLHENTLITNTIADQTHTLKIVVSFTEEGVERPHKTREHSTDPEQEEEITSELLCNI